MVDQVSSVFVSPDEPSAPGGEGRGGIWGKVEAKLTCRSPSRNIHSGHSADFAPGALRSCSNRPSLRPQTLTDCPCKVAWLRTTPGGLREKTHESCRVEHNSAKAPQVSREALASSWQRFHPVHLPPHLLLWSRSHAPKTARKKVPPLPWRRLNLGKHMHDTSRDQLRYTKLLQVTVRKVTVVCARTCSCRN